MKRIAAGEYEYKGFWISKTEHGEWNFGRIGKFQADDTLGTLKSVKTYIDRLA